MDNAPKALLMAGGILFTLIVISIFIMSYNKITEMSQQKQDALNVKEIVKFNEPFISYQKKEMYGTDIISVLHLAISNNKRYNVENSGEEYYVKIIVEDNVADNVADDYSFNNMDNAKDYCEKHKTDDEAFKGSVFQCKEVNYDSNGRVKEMTFNRIK